MQYHIKLKKKGVTAAKLQQDFGFSLRWAQYIMAGNANLPLKKAHMLKEKYKLSAKDFF